MKGDLREDLSAMWAVRERCIYIMKTSRPCIAKSYLKGVWKEDSGLREPFDKLKETGKTKLFWCDIVCVEIWLRSVLREKRVGRRVFRWHNSVSTYNKIISLKGF